MKLFNNIKEGIKTRIAEIKEDRKIAQEERKIFNAAKKESYLKERMIVANKEGKEKARQPTGFKAFQAGLENMSKKMEKIAPPPKKNSNNNTKQPTMLDMKF